ncbi:MAG: integration host factor, actinobacterial type [Acidimicrobiia bacterium]
MGDPPKLTPEQRAAALAKAAEARRVRAEMREALRSGEMTLADALDRSGDDLLGGTKVKAVLTALPGLGKVKSHRLMEQLGIAENRRLRGLGRKQREALLAELS